MRRLLRHASTGQTFFSGVCQIVSIFLSGYKNKKDRGICNILRHPCRTYSGHSKLNHMSCTPNFEGPPLCTGSHLYISNWFSFVMV